MIGRVAGGKPILAVEDREIFVESNIECDCALELIGDSMEPEFKSGDILLVKRQPTLENGEFGIILIMEGAEIAEATFKKFYSENGSVLLKSINPKYDPIEIKSKNIMIFGTEHLLRCSNPPRYSILLLNQTTEIGTQKTRQPTKSVSTVEPISDH